MRIDAFMACIVVIDDHWLWKGRVDKDGLCRFRAGPGKQVSANRFAAEMVLGRIPTGHLVRRCSEPGCVRFAPGHWEESEATHSPPAELRQEGELTAEERAAAIAMHGRGARFERVARKFRLTIGAAQRLIFARNAQDEI